MRHLAKLPAQLASGGRRGPAGEHPMLVFGGLRVTPKRDAGVVHVTLGL
jgi:hypothetical protein